MTGNGRIASACLSVPRNPACALGLELVQANPDRARRQTRRTLRSARDLISAPQAYFGATTDPVSPSPKPITR
jgi:hypothetical protein